MTTYQKCRAIRRVIVNRAAEVMEYKNWDMKFAVEQIRKLPEEIYKMKNGENYFDIQPAEMTDEQMEELGFILRNEDNHYIRAIPLWLLPFLAEKIKVGAINGKEKIINKSEIYDFRLGCASYGIITNK